MTDTDRVERVARAIDDAQFGFSINLTRLVDGEATYTLTFNDSPDAALAFSSHEEAYEEVTKRRRLAQARAALSALEAEEVDASDIAWAEEQAKKTANMKTYEGPLRRAYSEWRDGGPGLFRKKPVVIKAVQWTGQNADEVEAFLAMGPYAAAGYVKGDYVDIGTLEGLMVASPGDWIIKGVKGEFYPCKPGIFAATYEKAEGLAAPAVPAPAGHISPDPLQRIPTDKE